MLCELNATLATLGAQAPGPQFSAESIYSSGAMIVFVGISAVLLNLLILMIFISISARVIDRLSGRGEGKD